MLQRKPDPLLASISRNLSDKLYERRKLGALEVEQLVKEYTRNKESNRIMDIIQAIRTDFIESSSMNARKGGLIAMAAVALGLGDGVNEYVNHIIPPVIICFDDQDHKVRYYALESLFNITKVSKGTSLVFLNEIFDSLCKMAADPDKAVKDGAELLDRLIKDVITEGHKFDVKKFIPLLANRVNITGPDCRRFIVGWIRTLASVPDVELLGYLPHFLDGLFNMLSDQSKDITQSVDDCLSNFLEEIKEWESIKSSETKKETDETKEPPDPLITSELQPLTQIEEPLEKPERPRLSRLKLPPPHPPLNLLETETQMESHDLEIEVIKELQSDVELPLKSGRKLSSEEKKVTTPEHQEESTTLEDGEGPLVTFLDTKKKSQDSDPGEDVLSLFESPNVSPKKMNLHSSKKKIRTSLKSNRLTPPRIHYRKMVKILIPHCKSPDEFTAQTALHWINEFIIIAKEALLPYGAQMLSGILPQISHKNRSIEKAARKANGSLQSLIKNTSTQFPIKEFLETITVQFTNQYVPTRLYALRWILILHQQTPDALFQHLDQLFPALLNMLLDSAEEVLRLDLQVLAKLATNEDYFLKLMSSLVYLFCSNKKLLEGRASLVIRLLCVYIRPEKIYRALAEILETSTDIEFASTMIQTLNLILLTSSELVEVRNNLKHLASDYSKNLFTVLYSLRSWCHNEAAVFSLCLLAQVYEHASNLVFKFAEFEITVNTLVEIDKLVQLLESPIFMYLRLQLLEPEKYPYLFKSLYGLLMLLPQSSAFNTLRNRLNCITSLGVLQLIPKSKDVVQPPSEINFTELLDHFVKVQKKHFATRSMLWGLFIGIVLVEFRLGQMFKVR